MRGGRYERPFTFHPDGLSAPETDRSNEALCRLNDIRARAITPLSALKKETAGRRPAKDMAAALYAFLVETGYRDAIADRADSFEAAGEAARAAAERQLFAALCRALDQMALVVGDRTVDAADFGAILREVLGGYRVGVIPTSVDAVEPAGSSGASTVVVVLMPRAFVPGRLVR